MWICPHCGERHEDQFNACWKCAAVEPESPIEPLPRPERIRTFSAILGRAFLGLLFGAVMGTGLFMWLYGLENEQALLVGMAVGLACGTLAGVILWVFFPVKKDDAPDSSENP